MREVRGVRRAAAARMSLAKAKSDGGIGLLNHGYVLRKIRLGRALGGRRLMPFPKGRPEPVSMPIPRPAGTIEQPATVAHTEKAAAARRDPCHHNLRVR